GRPARSRRRLGSLWREDERARRCTGRGGKPLADDVALATHLLRHHDVAIVPGSAFGAPGHARLSYATSDANIEKGCAQIAEGLAALS
ncbi:MAG: aminotransferase class I/II-fold pyridoxal phosphate-dependent enzyme, partial [Myxococcota bacterium]